MSLVPPANIAFHFRAQGFPLSSMTIATILSSILWVSFLRIREPAQLTEPSKATARWEIVRYAWFALSASVLTVLAVCAEHGPVLGVPLPVRCVRCASGRAWKPERQHAGCGSHLTALATATWFATARRADTSRSATPAARGNDEARVGMCTIACESRSCFKWTNQWNRFTLPI